MIALYTDFLKSSKGKDKEVVEDTQHQWFNCCVDLVFTISKHIPNGYIEGRGGSSSASLAKKKYG